MATPALHGGIASWCCQVQDDRDQRGAGRHFHSPSLLALNSINSVLLICICPHGLWMAYVLQTYQATLNLATLSSILAYLQGTLPENWFSNMFLWLSFLSIVPATLGCVLDPAAKAVISFQKFAYKCCCLFSAVKLPGNAASSAA